MHRDFFLNEGSFNDLLDKGLLYEFISWIFNFNTRDEGKDQMWKILYSPSQMNKKIRKVFEQYFPEVIEFTNIINKDYKKTKNSGRKHDEQSCTLAILLQTLEAQFVLDTLIPDIMDFFPEMPIFTIHYSILVPEGHEEAVKDLIEFIAEERLGFSPVLKMG